MSTTVVELVPTTASDNNTETKVSRLFQVTFDSVAYSNPIAALVADGIPARGDLYPATIAGMARPRAISLNSTLADANSRLIYNVEVEYSNAPEKDSENNTEDNSETPPWERAAKHSYDFNEYEAALEVDFSDTPKPVVNGVGDKFDPPVTRQKVMPRVVITRARQNFDQSIAVTLYNSTNNAEVTINGKAVAIDMARLVKWSAEPASWADEDGVEHDYYEETIEIELATDTTNGFKLQVANTGYRYLVGGVPTLIPEITTPAFLSADGTAYQSGGTITPNYLLFKVYESKSWAPLDL
jgi:hypothetical protein